MKIALAQTNPVIGDFDHNVRLVTDRIKTAVQAGCELVLFPELSLCGYPPQDLLQRSSFIKAHDQALDGLIKTIGDIGVVLGALEQRQGSGKPLYNSALLIHRGKVIHRARKQLLPTYDVFDESRYFESGGFSMPFTFHGLSLGLTVCEDIWHESMHYSVDPVACLTRDNDELDILINISASPYSHGKLGERNRLFGSLCRENDLPLLYVNQAGGQDSLVFDGHSMAVNQRGEIVAVAAGFSEDMLIVDSADLLRSTAGTEAPEDSIAQVQHALVLGMRDYLHKTGFEQAVLGLSGGIDSAVTAVLAVLALGPENVLCLALPSPYTSQMSIDDARELAENLGCGFEIIPISGAMEAYHESLVPFFKGLAEDVTEQNIQARIRGNLLMALSNKFGSLVLATGNKSEMAVGYCTLYGDMSGGLAALADVPKVMVYDLARWMNREKEIIPDRIITRPPTAELKEDQCDQDDLPSYEVLDPILAAYLEEHLSVDEITARGFKRRVVEDIIHRIRINEHKRKQAPLGLKVTSKAFGHGRRYPIVQGFKG
ncbi:MAG: NAD+ synthase [Thermodesulfobacteriota bacterium]|nr:NAD+ synthase [Thermodesulfobacteriota bacterium]